MASRNHRVMIVAGEASGDLHAAKLVRALTDLEPGVSFEFFGAAGPNMRSAGVEATVAADELSIVGLLEIGRALPTFWRAWKALVAAAEQRKPDAVILVDFPDFNLKMARALKRRGFKVIYYISPQLWAWRKYRIASIRRYVDLLITILPFEKQWYEKHGVTNVEYVGSPLAREVAADKTKEQFCSDAGLDPDKTIVALLPGSRHKEIDRILPVMLDAAVLIAKQKPQTQFVIAAASVSSREDIDAVIRRVPADELEFVRSVSIVEQQTYDLLNASDAAAVTSGTATLETGIIGTPLAIVYKTSRANYALLKPFISVEHYGLINLIAGERVAAELIQHGFTPRSLADEVLRLLDPAVNADQRERLRAAAEKLGHGGASKRAAELIEGLIRG